MKVLKKIFLVAILFTLISIPKICFADSFQRETEETMQVISEDTKKAVNSAIQIKDGYQKFVIIEGILLLVAVFAIVKTEAIGTSTKVFILIAVLGIAAYVFRFSIDGTIIKFLDLMLQFLGVLIIVMANIFIYKHDNLLIYVPVYVVGMFFCFNYLVFIKDNVICKLMLIIAPIALYILGGIKQKADEKIFMKPVEIKKDKKDYFDQ